MYLNNKGNLPTGQSVNKVSSQGAVASERKIDLPTRSRLDFINVWHTLSTSELVFEQLNRAIAGNDQFCRSNPKLDLTD